MGATSADVWLSTVLQMDTANTQAASANIRLRWNYRPDSDLYMTTPQDSASLPWLLPTQCSSWNTVSR